VEISIKFIMSQSGDNKIYNLSQWKLKASLIIQLRAYISTSGSTIFFCIVGAKFIQIKKVDGQNEKLYKPTKKKKTSAKMVLTASL